MTPRIFPQNFLYAVQHEISCSSYHEQEQPQDEEDGEVPVLGQEEADRRQALLGKQDLAQSGQRTGRIDLGQTRRGKSFSFVF